MKNNVRIVFGLVFMSLFAGLAVAQEDRVVSSVGSIYVISAKAGGVSYVEGKVSVVRKEGKSGLLIKDDQIEVGDRVSTGPDSKAEILLNPGSYLRLGANTSFEFLTTSLDDLKLKLHGGSAVVEVLASDEFAVAIALPNASLSLTRSGVFRIDVLGNGSGRVSVWKGKMFIDGDSELKSGRALVVTGSNTTVAKFDRDSPDDLDTWSKLRAREISSVNARLERDSMRNSLLNSYNNGRWNAFNSFGLWVFDPFRRMWSFLPFGSGWGSPYGYDYRFDMWNYCNMPYWVYTNPNGNGNGTGTGGGGSTGGGGTTTVPNANRERTDNLRTPPFQRTNQAGSRVERNESDSPVFNGSGDGMNTNNQRRRVESDDSPNNDSKPVRTPPPPPPTPIIVIQNPNSKSKDN